MAKDFMPHQDELVLPWGKNLLGYAGPRAGAFNIPATVIPPLQTLLADYETALAAVQRPDHSKVDVLNKNRAKDAFVHSLRVFIKAYLAHNPAVSDADREQMGLPIYDTKRTPVPVPSTFPEIEFDSSVIRQIGIHFRDAGSDRRGKPDHVHGIELRWSLLDHPPASVDELTKSVFDTASPCTLTFGEEDRGKSLYVCPAWENSKWESGPWGEIMRAIVP